MQPDQLTVILFSLRFLCFVFHCNILTDYFGLQISKREAFFKSEAPSTRYEAPSTKFDPSLRERDGKAEKLGGGVGTRENGHGRLTAGSRTDSSKSLEGYVGFANLPNQVYRKSVKRGFEFTLMVVG